MNPENKEKRLRRPLLVTTTFNDQFLTRCFARSHNLQNFDIPVYIRKFLKPDEKEIEKQILSKRYQMIHSEGKDEYLFRVKKISSFITITL